MPKRQKRKHPVTKWGSSGLHQSLGELQNAVIQGDLRGSFSESGYL